MTDARCRLPQYRCLRVAGEDRITFLQGQFSADIAALGSNRAALTAHSNRQGRAFCTALAWADDEAVMLLLPAAQADDTLARLKMYVLRSRVELSIAGDALAPAAQWDDSAGILPADEWTVGQDAAGRPAVRLPGTVPRWLTVGPADAEDDGRWRFEDVRAGLPQVYPETREQFLPQALNLDALDGISFEKGCYVGQEVIARLHFRGTVKRRMRPFALPASATLPVPGDELRAAGETAGKVVDAARYGDDAMLLAVCPVNAQLDDCRLPDDTPLRALDLPYSLPSS
jgi:folate-binding protein YgfZ